MKPDPPSSVDEYLARVESDKARAALKKLRSLIRKTVPEAKEVISYGIPTYKFNRTSVAFAAFKKHCSFFPGHTVGEFTKELKDYKTSTGTVQFSPDDPLLEPLVVAILKARFWPKQ